jgi:hypothetical protein
MALQLPNLDEKTRALMVDEIDRDVTARKMYFGKRLRPDAFGDYAGLLRKAAQDQDSTWLAAMLERHFLPGSPRNAAELLSDGEFNRFYMRALCLRAIEEGRYLEVIRVKQVREPRPESMMLLGTEKEPRELLEILRKSPDDSSGPKFPPGPGSGLGLKLGRKIREPFER